MELLDWLNKLKRPAIGLTFQKPDGPLAPNASKFGGHPYLPDNFEWPYYEGRSLEDGEVADRPLTFLLQIDLAEVARYDTEGLLPRSGMLYFFYEYVSMAAGLGPRDKGCARVYYYDCPVAELKETLPPSDYYETVMDEEFEFPELAIDFSQQVSTPDHEEFNEYHYGDKTDYDEFGPARDQCIGREDDDFETYTQMLGFADIVQESMLFDCERFYKGEKEVELTPEQREEIFERSKDWMLLMQIGHVSDDDDFELEWCDGGLLYFYIRKEDLLAKRFDRIWLVMQCC